MDFVVAMVTFKAPPTSNSSHVTWYLRWAEVGYWSVFLTNLAPSSAFSFPCASAPQGGPLSMFLPCSSTRALLFVSRCVLAWLGGGENGVLCYPGPASK